MGYPDGWMIGETRFLLSSLFCKESVLESQTHFPWL
jgi:hypothetical protein